jgi:hypothetical protein
LPFALGCAEAPHADLGAHDSRADEWNDSFYGESGFRDPDKGHIWSRSTRSYAPGSTTQFSDAIKNFVPACKGVHHFPTSASYVVPPFAYQWRGGYRTSVEEAPCFGKRYVVGFWPQSAPPPSVALSKAAYSRKFLVLRTDPASGEDQQEGLPGYAAAVCQPVVCGQRF